MVCSSRFSGSNHAILSKIRSRLLRETYEPELLTPGSRLSEGDGAVVEVRAQPLAVVCFQMAAVSSLLHMCHLSSKAGALGGFCGGWPRQM